jgi:hypothetical protein
VNSATTVGDLHVLPPRIASVPPAPGSRKLASAAIEDNGRRDMVTSESNLLLDDQERALKKDAFGVETPRGRLI